MIKPILLFLTLSLLLINTQTCTVTNVPAVDLGNHAVVCAKVTIVDSSNVTSNYEWYFKTIIDQFSSLKMTGLAGYLANATSAQVTLYFQNSATNTTFILVDTANSIQRHFLSAVINLSGGSLSTIVGDNFCDNGCVCYQNQCFESSSGGYGSIDGQIYISWGGDDSNGKSCLSSARRLSRFNMYSVNGVYSSVKASMGY